MDSINISDIRFKIELINLKNLQELLKLGEAINAHVVDVEQNTVVLDIKGTLVKAFSNITLQKHNTLSLLVARLTPFVELKIIDQNFNKDIALNVKTTIDNIFINSVKFTQDNFNSQDLANYIKTSFENITNALSDNNLKANYNIFFVIPYYIDNKEFKVYVKTHKKLTKQKKMRYTLTVYSQTPIGFIKINIIKIDSMWCNIWVYEKDVYDWFMLCKKELEEYVNLPIRIVLNYNKPTVEMIQSINYLNVLV